MAASQLAYALGLTGDEPDAVTGDRVTVADGRQTVLVSAVTGAYEPAHLQVAAGLPTTLIVRSAKARGCVRAFVIPDLGIEKILPISGDTRIDLGVLKPGTLAYSCSMGMYTGRLTITEATP
ncbi:cupredoxin domain-containing protein [Catellatospora bangladeshensis]|uniref:cupredoxin domain-containing protein n=1 Tax=Catellatospora bangladeshensis TaxID=310355 RepID=UPI003608A2FE